MPVSQADPRHPPLYLTSPLLARSGLPHLFSTRHFPGVRPWRDPRGPFDTSALAGVDTGGVPAEGFAFARQVHGADVVVATRAGFGGPGRRPDDRTAGVAARDLHRRLRADRGLRCAQPAARDGACGVARHGRARGSRCRRCAREGRRAGGDVPGGHRAVDRPVLLRGGRPGDRSAGDGVSRVDGAVGHGDPPGQMDARSLEGQRGPVRGGGSRRVAHRRPAALHGVSRGSLLFLPPRARGGRLVALAALPDGLPCAPTSRR